MTAIDDQFDPEEKTISLDADLDTIVVDPERHALLDRLLFDLVLLREQRERLDDQADGLGVDIGDLSVGAAIAAVKRQMGAL